MFDIEKIILEIQCPNCHFYNPIFFKQAKLRDVIICRGCKINIRLDDQMNECQKACRSISKAMKELDNTLKTIKNVKIHLIF